MRSPKTEAELAALALALDALAEEAYCAVTILNQGELAQALEQR
jgi:hypothetical protein